MYFIYNYNDAFVWIYLCLQSICWCIKIKLDALFMVAILYFAYFYVQRRVLEIKIHYVRICDIQRGLLKRL